MPQDPESHCSDGSKRRALIVVDVQNDFCCPNGSLAVLNAEEILPRINQLKKIPGLYQVVVLTVDWHPADHISFASQHSNGKSFSSVPNPSDLSGAKLALWPDHCVAGTKGAELHPELAVLPSDIIIKKGLNRTEECFSGFGTPSCPTHLQSVLKANKINVVDVVGLALDYCVYATAIDAAQVVEEVTVLLDCTKAVGDSEQKIKELRNCGIRMATSKEIIMSSREN